MPLTIERPAGPGKPQLVVRLSAHNSLTPRGFVWFIGVTCALISVPLLSVIGTAVLWALLPFVGLTVGGVWLALQRSWRDRSLSEELTLWEDVVALEHRAPRQTPKRWQANPHWVEVKLWPDGGPVENYVTLRGAGREVEIGAFLSPEERSRLYGTLSRALGPAAA